MGRLNDDWYDRMFELLMRQDQEDAEAILDKIADAANRAEAKKKKQEQQSTQKEEEMTDLILEFDEWVGKYYSDKLGKYEPMTKSAAQGVAKVLVKLMDSGYYFGL
jgi:uncharacterized protein with von Willebrand factor type A (vWA) domain